MYPIILLVFVPVIGPGAAGEAAALLSTGPTGLRAGQAQGWSVPSGPHHRHDQLQGKGGDGGVKSRWLERLSESETHFLLLLSCLRGCRRNSRSSQRKSWQ